MRPSALFLFCRGEPTGTLMRDYCFDTCCHLQRTLARTVPKLVALSAYPRAYGSDASTPCSVLYTGFYASYCPSLHTFLIIYLYLLYK